MTQYKNEVKKQKLKNEAEDWGKRIKYLEARDGILTTAYNNGSFKYEETKKGGKIWTEHTDQVKKQNLLDKFLRWVADRDAGFDSGER